MTHIERQLIRSGEDLILEQLARNRAFLGFHGLQQIRSAFVIVVGCGGVGSHAAAALARSGVSKLRLIDFDQVTLSSLNRHAVATLADVGISKVSCLRKRLQQITPWVNFDCRNEMFKTSRADHLLSGWIDQSPTYVVDAIDNITSKVDLLKYCCQMSIPVISSMGAGTKSDPTRIFVGDISLSTEDPLSRSTRRRLRALGISSGIVTVFSDEKAGPEKAQLLPLPEAEFACGGADDLGVLPAFRARILPVLGTMPAVFGLCAANHILLEISGYPHDYSVGKARHKVYEGILGNLQASEERLLRTSGVDSHTLRIPISQQDVGYVVDEIYRGRSAISALTTRLTTIRWSWQRHSSRNILVEQCEGQKTVELDLADLVVMTKEEATRHEREVLRKQIDPAKFYDDAVVTTVERRRKEIQAYNETK